MRHYPATAFRTCPLILLITAAFLVPFLTRSQNIERIHFDDTDSTEGYYLAVQPQSKKIQGVLVLLTSFLPPEGLLPETKLHNVACVNNLLTIAVSCKQKLYADSAAVARLNLLLGDVQKRFAANKNRFALAGYGEAGNIALRYTELCYEKPAAFPLQPKALIGIDAPVDLFGLWHWAEKQIKKNYWAVGDAHYYLDAMTREHGSIYDHLSTYKNLSPFYAAEDSTGNERYLQQIPLRLYYDTDIQWQLQNRRNGLYDTKLPDATELVKRLLLQGNKEAAFIPAKQPGVRSDGTRSPAAMSIVDEVECIQWIKKSLGIFDARTWIPPYHLLMPEGWSTELFELPPDFAPQIVFQGAEDIRFAPGWGNIQSEEHWAYGFLWWLQDNYTVDAAALQTSLQAYYSGLLARNISSRNIPANKIIPTVAAIKKTSTAPADLATFSGTISMLDYHAKLPILLHIIAHVKDSRQKNTTAVFFEVSPQPLTHPVWQKLHEIEKSFAAGAGK